MSKKTWFRIYFNSKIIDTFLNLSRPQV